MESKFVCDYSEKEFASLNEKAMYPNKTVICPRCGNELTFHAIGNSYEVKCKTDGCISEISRGL